MSGNFAWGIIGTGAIAKAFARGLSQSRTGRLAAVGSRSQETADKFGQEFNVPKRYGSYEAMLADPEVQAVYVSTPHPMHAEWAIKAAEAGKNVLCEKPFALNYPEAMAMFEAAAKGNVLMMEAFMYRCHPQTKRLVELIREKAIGEVRMIQASFGFRAGFNPESRLWKNALAGGGIMDVGCYPVSMSRLIAAAALGTPVADPLDVKGAGKLASTGVDEHAAATLVFPGDIIAQVATAVNAGLENTVRIFGTEGNILLPNPWTAGRVEGGSFKIVLTRKGQTEEIVIETPATAYAFEADVVGDAVAAGLKQGPFPAMSWDDTLGNMKTLDAWRAAAGVVYDMEKPENVTYTASRRPLAKSPAAPMKYGQVPGLDKAVSRLVMGVDNQRTMPVAAVMFDAYFEQGGNTFDSAFIYSGGLCEKMIGQWIKNRGLREQVVILDKGAHTPFCDPDNLTAQLLQSLDRLGTHIDIYMMHRDNPAIPVGEFIDVLNEHVKAGRIKVFGGSNWSIERVKKANAYAKRKGLQGFSAISNNFSLARMVDPVWGGCIAASDAASRAWLKRTQMVLMPWSSQARGFFTDRGNPEDKSDKEMVRCWHSEDNFQRRERAIELAKAKGVLPINVALAYVLCQPFPTFPLIGPRTLAELRTSLPGLGVELTAKELKWLNLET